MKKTFETLIDRLLYPSIGVRILLVFTIMILEGVSAYTVHLTGGTTYSYIHVFYIPIILAGTIFGFSGGGFAALLAFALTHPSILASDVALGTPQSLENWAFRGIFFMLIGFLSGVSASIFRRFLKSREERLLRDSITGLPNFLGLRKVFRKRHADLENDQPSVIVILIRRLQEIDTAVGPNTTEKLLWNVGQDLKNAVDDCTTVGSLGTGGFALLVDPKKSCEQIIETCKKQLGPVYTIDKIPLFLEIHYGVVHGESAKEPLSSLLRKAKIAAGLAVENERTSMRFEKEDDAKSKRNVALIHDFSEAIRNNELNLHYQPKISFKTGRVIGVEALVRWKHPKYGMIPPNEFIPLSETTVLINPFTKWLVQESFKQLARWRERKFPITLSLNFSMKNFQDPTVVEEIHKIRKLYEIPPSDLEIEVTESAVANDINKVADILLNLHKQGIKIAVDDFGTGHSALHYLFELPFDIIKIDQVFIRSMLSNSAADAIVRSAILLGHELNLQVVAEGIETKEEFDRLKSMGCDIAQGFWFARPMPAELATSWIDSKLKQDLRIRKEVKKGG